MPANVSFNSGLENEILGIVTAEVFVEALSADAPLSSAAADQ